MPCAAFSHAWILICSSVRESRPDRNAFVERYHRSYQSECLAVHQPRTLQEVRARDRRLSAALQPSTAESGS
jgi:hypothetical protein